MRDLFRNRSQERSFELLETRAMLTTVSWDGEGGDLQWHTAANWDSDVVPGIQDDVIIDIPNSETVINIGANADVLSLQSSEGIKVSSGTLTLRSESSLAALEMTQGTAFVSEGSGTSVIVTGATTADGANVLAQSGSTISLPNLTSYSAGDIRADRYFRARGEGSHLDLPSLTSLTGNSRGYSVYLQADRAGSRISLPALETLTDISVYAQSYGENSRLDLSKVKTWTGVAATGRESSLDARDGGAIDVSALTAPDHLTFRIDDTATIPTSQLTSIVEGDVDAREGANVDLSGLTQLVSTTVQVHSEATANLDNVLTAEKSQLLAYSGGKLALPKLTRFSGSDIRSDRYIRARGEGSVVDLPALTELEGNANGYSIYLQADQPSGQIKLPSLESITDASVYTQAYGENALVDLSKVKTWTGVAATGRESSLDARDGGAIDVSALTSPDHLSIRVDDTATIPTSQLTSIIEGDVDAREGANIDLSGLTQLVSTTLQVHGEATANLDNVLTAEKSQLLAYSGGKLTLPKLTRFSGADIRNDRYIRARGEGSVVDLPALTELEGNANGYSIYLQADQPGGQIKLPSLESITDASVYAQAYGDNSLVDLSKLRTWTGVAATGRESSLDARDGGAIDVSALTSPDHLSIRVDDTATIPTGQLTSIVEGDVDAREGANIDLSGLTQLVSTTIQVHSEATANLDNVLTAEKSQLLAYSGGKLTLPKLTRFSGSDIRNDRYIRARGEGSVVDLPALTELEGNANGYSIYLQADQTGGQIKLPSLESITDASVYTQAYGENALVDLPVLTTWRGPAATGRHSSLDARDAGVINIGQLTEAEQLSIRIDDTATIATSQLTSLLEGNVEVREGATPDLSNLTSADEIQFLAYSGGKLVVPNLASYSAGDIRSDRYFRARGEGSLVELPSLTSILGNANGYSLYVQVDQAGGQIKLTALESIENASVYAQAFGENTTVEMPNVTTWNGQVNNGRESSVDARDGGAIDIGKLTTAANLDFRIDGNGQITTEQFESLVESSISAYSGAKLSFDGLTSFSGGDIFSDHHFVARGDGSSITFPVLAEINGSENGYSLYVQADQPGGQINLPLLSTLDGQSVYVQAFGENTQVNLPNLTTWRGQFNDNGRESSVDARGGGGINIGKLITATNLDFRVDANGQITLDQFESLSESSVSAYAGGQINFPNLKAYSAGDVFSDHHFVARGDGSSITFPVLTEISGSENGYSLYLQADQAGGQINLPLVSKFDNQSVYVQAFGENSQVNLPNLTTWNGQFNDNGRESSVDARIGGNIDIGKLTTATNLDFRVDADGQITLDQFESLSESSVSAYAGGQISFPNLKSYTGGDAFSDHAFVARGANSIVGFPVLSEIISNENGYSLYIQADQPGGQVNLPAVSTFDSQSVYVQAFGENSQVNLPSLTTWNGKFPNGRKSSVDVRGGGKTELGDITAENVMFALSTGGIVDIGTLNVRPSSNVQGTGIVDGNLVNDGTITFGSSIGTIEVLGDFEQKADGVSTIRVGGVQAGTSLDRFLVHGDVKLDGTLNVTPSNGFTPPIGSRLDVIESDGSLTGEFNQINGRQFGSGVKVEPEYTSDAFVLNPVADAGPKVVSTSTPPQTAATIETFDIVFDEPIVIETVNADTISVTGPNGDVPFVAATLIGNDTARVTIQGEVTPGEYQVSVGPGVTDLAENAMDQDGDAINGEAEDTYETSFTLTDDEQSVLLVNVDSRHNDVGRSIYQTILDAGARVGWINLDTDGAVAAKLASNDYDQVWVFDVSERADNYPTDWTAIANWFNQDTSQAVVADGRIYSSYAHGRWQDEGSRLSQNYYTNIRDNGGGLVLGTDHDVFHTGINEINGQIGIEPFTGNFSLPRIPVDTESPLMTSPNDMGPNLFDDSTPGQTPFGLQPNGRILYTVAWHSGDFNTPGISSTIAGQIGFQVNVISPSNGQRFSENTSIRFEALETAGVAPFTHTWTSSIDGELGVGASLETPNLTPGDHEITLLSVDSAGGADSQTFTIVVTPGAARVTVDLQEASDTGASVTDNITNVLDPVFDISANRPGSIEVFVDGSESPSAVFDVEQANPGSIEFSAGALTEGPHSVVARFVPDFGNAVQNRLSLVIDTTAPQISQGGSERDAPVSDHLIVFTEALDPTFSSGGTAQINRPDGSSFTIDAIVEANTLALTFPPLTEAGRYEVVSETPIRDIAGNLFDGNRNGVGGEPEIDDLKDAFELIADRDAPSIISTSLPSQLNRPLSTLVIEFSEQMDLASLAPSQLRVLGAGSEVAATNVTALDGNAFEFQLSRTISNPGSYQLRLGLGVSDLAGNRLDLDADGVSGERNDDEVVADFDMLSPFGTNLLINPGFEDGLVGWDVTGGRIRTGSPAPHGGSQFLIGGRSGSNVNSQTIDLSVFDGVLSRVDAGQVTARFGGWQADWDSDNDQGRIELRFLNADSENLLAHDFGFQTYNFTWTLNEETLSVPEGTRFVQFVFDSRRAAGSNNDGYLDDAFVELFVNEGGPTFEAIQPVVTNELTTISIPISATAESGGSVSYSVSPGSPQGLAVDAETGVVSWTPTEAQGPGQFTASILLSDDESRISIANFSIRVDEVNRAPSITEIEDIVLNDDAIVRVPLIASDPDLPAQLLSFSLGENVTTAASIDSEGNFVFTPTEVMDGDYPIEVLVSDNGTPPLTDSISFNVRADRSLPDLVVPPSSIVIPANLKPGDEFDISWTIRNIGGDVAPGGWNGTVYFSRTAEGDDLTPITNFTFEQSLEPNSEASVTRSFTLPQTGPANEVYVLVALDTLDGVPESDDANRFVGATPTTIEPTLKLEVANPSLIEGQTTTQGTLTRNGDVSEALTVRLETALPNQLELPTLVIPAGQFSTRFVIAAVDDETPEPTRSLSLTASANRYTSDEVGVTIVDNDLPQLTVTFANDRVIEGESTNVTVSTSIAPSEDTTIQIVTRDLAQLAVPNRVVIPAGTTAVAFDAVAIDDAIFEQSQFYFVRAEASGYQSGTDQVVISQNDEPQLSLTLSADEFSEGTFGPGLFGTVARDSVLDFPLVVSLNSANTNKLSIPSRITIPTGQASSNFRLNIVDDENADDVQLVTISAKSIPPSGGAPIDTGAAQVQAKILDNDGPSLFLSLDNTLISEQGQTELTVTRNTPPTNALQVTFSSNDETEIDLAETSVVIPAGQTSATIQVFGKTDMESDGSQLIRISGAANGFNTGVAVLFVSDIDLPDLEVTELTTSATGLTDASTEFSWTIANVGNTVANGIWSQRLFLSTDLELDEDDHLVGEYSFSGPVPDQQAYDRTVAGSLPNTPGIYYPILITDINNGLTEILETNNGFVSMTAIEIGPAYSATVQANIDTAPADTSVTLSGSARRIGGGAASFERVSVHVSVEGTTRVLPAITDANGNFATVFTPLPGEGGNYQVGASHPGMLEAPIQDMFSLLGMRAEPSSAAVNIKEQSTVICDADSPCQVSIRNLSDVPLSGIQVAAIDVPDSLEVAVDGPAELQPMQRLPLSYSIKALDPSVLSGEFRLSVSSNEAPAITIPIQFSVTPLRSQLSPSVRSLKTNMLVGDQTSVEFTVTNAGGKETGPLTVLLPTGAPWLTLASPEQMPSIPPGENANVTLLLTPAEALALTAYRGTMIVRGDEGEIRMPFNFRAISDETGDLAITVVDEYFYFAENSPTVEGATVVLKDAITGETLISSDDFVPSEVANDGEIVAAAMSDGPTVEIDDNGRVTFAGVPEGPYTLEVRSPDHESYRNTVEIAAGETNAEEVFITRNLVEYIWTVEEVEIEDRTKITIESVFETNVPAPVVTMEHRNPGEAEFKPGAAIDLAGLDEIGQTKQIDFKVTNHGLIAAENVEFNLGSHPFYEITPLIDVIGVLPAKSELIIPVTVRRIANFDSFDAQARAVAFTEAGLDVPASAAEAESVPCSITFYLVFTYICGPNNVTKSISIPIYNVQGRCPVYVPPPSRGGGGPGRGGGSTAGGAGGVTPVSIKTPDIECTDCIEEKWELSISNNGVLKKVVDAASSLLEIAPPIKDVDLTISGKAAWQDCCKDNEKIGSKLTASGEGMASVGFSIPLVGAEIELAENKNLPFKFPAGAQIDADLIGGIFLAGEIGGGVFGEVETDCEDWSKFTGCAGVKGGGKLELKAEFGINVDVEYLGKEYDFIISVAGGVRGSAEAFAKWCMDNLGKTNFSWEVVLGKVELFGLAKFAVGTETAELFALEDATEISFEISQTIIPGCKWSDMDPSGTCTLPSLASLAEPIYAGASRGPSDDGQPVHPVTGQPMELSASDIVDLDRLASDLGYQNAEELTAATGKDIDGLALASPDELKDLLETAAEVGDPQTTLPGVCAQVRIQIEQDAVQTRQGFEAKLQLNNGLPSALVGIGVDIVILDGNGFDVTSDFAVASPQISGFTGVEGAGVLGSLESGISEWLIVPTSEAAKEGPTDYYVGGTLTYIDGANDISIELSPASITVVPQPKLDLVYFHQRDVISDDPHTDEIESAEPFTLAVMVKNNGFGQANNLRIESAQPKIIENEKGLLIDFEIIGTKINGGEVERTLNANFGDLPAGGLAFAEWQLESTLQGLFVEYDVTFEHISPLGDRQLSPIGYQQSDEDNALSLVKSVEIRELIRSVDASPTLDDELPDFLVNDLPDPRDFPDTLYLSDGSIENVTLALRPEFATEPTERNLKVNLNATETEGWSYLRVEYPGGEDVDVLELIRVERNGVELPTKNFWQSDRTFIGGGDRPILENMIHILDHDSSGNYTLTFSNGDLTPPEILAFGGVEPNPTKSSINSISVAFSETLGDFDPGAIQLLKNGNPVGLTDSVTISGSAGNYSINGLAGLTADDAVYEIAIDLSQVTDVSGNAGSTIERYSWVKGEAAPTLVTFGGVPTGIARFGPTEIVLEFSEAIDLAASGPQQFLSLTRDGEQLVGSETTLTMTGERSYRVHGLATDVDGDYEIRVDGNAVVDLSGVAGIGSPAAHWSIDSTAPRIVDVIDIVTNPRNIVVQQIDVEFSEQISLDSLDVGDLSLIRLGEDQNLLAGDERVFFEHRFDNIYRIYGINWVQSQEGKYELTFRGSGIEDLAGNSGTGVASTTWSIDLTRPEPATNLGVETSTGNAANGFIDSRQAFVVGNLAEPNLTVVIRDEFFDQQLAREFVEGTSFRIPIEFLGSGQQMLSVRTVDLAGNTNVGNDVKLESTLETGEPQQASETLIDNLFVQESAPVVDSVIGPERNAINSIVDSVIVTFSSPIESTTFDISKLTFTVNGSVDLMTNAVNISPFTDANTCGLANRCFEVSGLADLSVIDGRYELMVSSDGVEDAQGLAATGQQSAQWLVDRESPSSTINLLDFVQDLQSFAIGISGEDPTITNEVAGSGVAEYDIYVADRDNELAYWTTVAADSPTANFVGDPGRIYFFQTVARDHAGNVENKTSLDVWTYLPNPGEIDTASANPDINGDGAIDATDIDTMAVAIVLGRNDEALDLNRDGNVNSDDREALVHEYLGTDLGDADLDGAVTFLDFIALATNFGTNAGSWSKGDFNGNGKVDFLDFIMLAQSFGGSGQEISERDLDRIFRNFGKTDAIWSDGDVTRDGRVDFRDFLLAAEVIGSRI